MPNHLSNLGIFHTIISIIALIFAFVALFRDGKIDPRNGLGKGYLVLQLITCLTSFGIMKTGHFTPAHTLSVIVLILLPLGMYARSIRLFGKQGEKIEIIVLTATLWLSFIPTVTETLTRLPISQPIAADPNAAPIKISLLIVTAIFAIILFFQLRKASRNTHITPAPVTMP